MKQKIVHIITDLATGGAQMMMYKLLKNIDLNKYQIEVISMIDNGVIGEQIQALGIQVHTLNIKKTHPNPLAIIKAIKICSNSHIIQTWMYHADLFGFIIAQWVKPKKIIWGIRHSTFDNSDKKSTVFIARINAALSKYVNHIISCSERAVYVHQQLGFNISNMIVIPNGFEVDRFCKRSESKKMLCDELDLLEDTIIIGRVARWHPMKDYEALFKAISLLQDYSNFVLICCGENIDNANEELRTLLLNNNIRDRVKLLGNRVDMEHIMSATDIHVSSSLTGEGFPNVLGEAMACEVPCVTTDVGDSAFVVGDTGEVVEPGDYKELAKAIKKIIDMSEDERRALGLKARQRIIEQFEVNQVCKKYQQVYNI